MNEVFISYSHDDEKWLAKLLKHLKPLLRDEPPAIWWDAKIMAGQRWRDEIDKALASAKVGVLLVSANFLHSDFITDNELPYLRRAADERRVKLLAVLVGNCLYDEVGLADIQFVNSPTRPLDRCRGGNLNDALVSICKAISKELEAIGLKQDLAATLKKQDVTIEKLVANPALGEFKKEILEAVESTLKNLLQIEKDTDGKAVSTEGCLELAKGFTIAGNWMAAATHYDKYIAASPDDWEVHFLRAVAYANCRGGNTTDLAALRAYGDAIALAPSAVDGDTRARLHTYRGAILKRLGRLDEALSELDLARRWAQADYEVNDNYYNLACVYALQRDKQKMLEHLRLLFLTPGWKERIRHSPYFAHFRKDEDFQELLEYA